MKTFYFYIISAVLFLTSFLFFKNNGDIMIPGFDLKSAEEIDKYKQEHNVKKMTTIIGIFFIVTAVMIAVAGYINNKYVTIGCVCAFVAILAFIYTYLKLGCKKN